MSYDFVEDMAQALADEAGELSLLRLKNAGCNTFSRHATESDIRKAGLVWQCSLDNILARVQQIRKEGA